MINYLILFQVLSFIFCVEGINNEEEKIPKIDLRDGLIFESDIHLQKYFDNGGREAAKILSLVEIDYIKLKAKEYAKEPVNNDEIAIFETSFGTLKFKLFPNIAPENCANFKKLANSGFYDSTLFHKLVPNFLIQGGDILSRDAEEANDGFGNPGWTIDAEFSDILHKKGTLSMHRVKNDPNSAGSQFFITLSRQKELDNNYTVIGEIIEGKNILDIISNVSSQSKIAFKMLKKNIPNNQDPSKWEEITLNSKKYYLNIPENVSRMQFVKMILERIENRTRPSVPIVIKSLRVQKDLN